MAAFGITCRLGERRGQSARRGSMGRTTKLEAIVGATYMRAEARQPYATEMGRRIGNVVGIVAALLFGAALH